MRRYESNPSLYGRPYGRECPYDKFRNGQDNAKCIAPAQCTCKGSGQNDDNATSYQTLLPTKQAKHGKKESKTALLPGPNKHTCATYTTATRKSKKTHYTLPDTTASTRSGRFANREQTYATCTTRMQPTGQRMNVDDFSCKRCFPSV